MRQMNSTLLIYPHPPVPARVTRVSSPVPQAVRATPSHHARRVFQELWTQGQHCPALPTSSTISNIVGKP